jgi:penicillin-binding protein 2
MSAPLWSRCRAVLLAALSLLLFSVSGPILAQNTPRDVVNSFLTAWNERDYSAMYSYIHAQSRETYPAPAFEARYQRVTEQLGLTGVTFTLGDVHLQGESAVVRYDVILDSGRFGEIEDPGRTMRLVNGPEGWRIAWSTMDIFDMLAGNAELTVQTRSSRRATIYDVEGRPLASDGGTTVVLYSARERMVNDEDCVVAISEIKRESYPRVRARFNRYNPDTVFDLIEMPTEMYEANRDRLQAACNLQNVYTSQPLRLYYGGNVVSHVTGYVGQIPQAQVEEYAARGYGSGELVGLAGVEQVYQDTLAGSPERVLRIVEPGGTVLRDLGSTPASPAAPVMLTINRDLQFSAAQALSDAFNYATPNWGDPGVSPGGAVVVLDVNSGAILALASYPLFDPTLFNPSSMRQDRAIPLQEMINDPRRPLRNRATQEQYPTGSAYKIVTGLAALNEGLVAPDDIFDCQYTWNGSQFGDTFGQRLDWRAIEQDEFPPTGPVTPAQALMASCNPFFYEYGARLYLESGSNTLVDYARSLGMGRSYNFGGVLPEVTGSLPTPTSVEDAINSAIGQGNIAVPPLQMAVMTATIANGGTAYNPYLVQQVGGMDGTQISFQAEPEVLNNNNFDPAALAAIQEGMCGVVTHRDYGTAYVRFNDPNWAPPINYTACGKTGTASTGRYPHAWFVAYAPAENPQIAVVVMVEQSLEGSQVAAPIVRRILDDYFGQPRGPFPWWWNEGPYVPLQLPDVGGIS